MLLRLFLMGWDSPGLGCAWKEKDEGTQSSRHQKIAAEGFVGCWGELEQAQVEGSKAKLWYREFLVLQSRDLRMQTLELHQQLNGLIPFQTGLYSHW